MSWPYVSLNYVFWVPAGQTKSRGQKATFSKIKNLFIMKIFFVQKYINYAAKFIAMKYSICITCFHFSGSHVASQTVLGVSVVKILS